MGLTVTDAYGCAFDLDQILELPYDFDLSGFQIPNVITPNDDGLNDYVVMGGTSGSCLKFSMTIYNRWGRRVYTMAHNTAPFAGLDESGEDLADGVYFYTFEAERYPCASTPELQNWCSGTIHVLRD